MSDKITKSPQIRFAGFTDAWEQRKLKNVANYIRGSFPQPYTNSDFYDEENGKPFVQVADIGFDLKLNPDTKAHISKIAEPKSRFVEAGKVVVALQGSIEKSIGRTAITQYDAYFDRTILIFEDYKVPMDKLYFAQVIKKLFEREKERAWGATISTITKEHLNDFVIGVPKIEEQKLLGNLFTNIDEISTLHQRKLELLKGTKKSLLQKMFPRDGANVPEIRFSGFTDAWEQRELGNHAEILTGGTPKTQIKEYWEPREIPWMSSGEVNKKRLSSTDNMISTQGFENSSARWVKENSVLIALAGQGKTRGTVAINEIPLTTNQSIAAIVPKDELHYEFIFQNLENRYEELRLISSGDGTRGGLNKQLISDVEIISPSVEEQIKIGNFFKQIDDTIALHQRELSSLKNLKKSLLQQMFV